MPPTPTIEARPLARRPGRGCPRAVLASALAACLVASLGLFAARALWAQAASGPSRLTGPEKKQLATIALEPVLAALEGRAPRTPSVGQRLNARQPLVVSMYLDGKLLARSWELARPGPLAGQAMLLSASMLDSPNYGNAPDPAVLSRVKVGVGVFYRFKEIKDETGLGDGEGVVVMNGFKEGVALPNDLPQGYKPQELLSFASQTGGMRPGAWLLPEATLLCAVVDEEILQ